MAVLAVLICEILELEFAHLLRSDAEVSRITVVNDERATRLIDALELAEANELRRISRLEKFTPNSRDGHEVLIRVLELGLHIWPQKLQEALLEAAYEIATHVDALLLGYGRCGNALHKGECSHTTSGPCSSAIPS